MTTRTRAAVVTALCAVALSLTACGNNAPKSKSSSASASAAADVLGAPNAAAGEPVRIGSVDSLKDQATAASWADIRKGAEIATKYANEYLGGIAGHPIQMEFCGDKATPATATDCANQLVEKKVSAYVHYAAAEEAPIVKIMTDAHIPMLLATAATPAGLTTPGVFVTTGGLAADFGAIAISMKEKGLKKIAILGADIPALTDAVNGLGGIVFKKEGLQFKFIPIPPSTADMTPQMQAAIDSGADAINIAGDKGFCTAGLQAYKAVGATMAKYLLQTCINPSVVEAVGDALAGANVATTNAPGSEDAIYAAAVAKYGDKSIDPDPTVNASVAFGWSEVMDLVYTMKGYAGPTDPASLLAQIKAAKDVPVSLSAGATASCDGKAIPALPNICSGGVQMAVVDASGKYSNYESIDASAAYAP